MKKLMMTLAAVLCCAMTTAVFTACGDDDVETLPVAGKYQYWVKLDYTESKAYNKTEQELLIAAMNKAVGLNGTVYEKTYNSRKDNEMKAACEAVLKQYSNLESLYLVFYLMTNDGEYGKEVAVSKLEAGLCMSRPYAKITMDDTKYDTKRMKALADSLNNTGNPADKDKWKAIQKTTNENRTKVTLFFKEKLKDVAGTWYYAESLEPWNAEYFNRLAAQLEIDTLAYDFTLTIRKETVPNYKNEVIWTKTFKANI